MNRRRNSDDFGTLMVAPEVKHRPPGWLQQGNRYERARGQHCHFQRDRSAGHCVLEPLSVLGHRRGDLFGRAIGLGLVASGRW